MYVVGWPQDIVLLKAAYRTIAANAESHCNSFTCIYCSDIIFDVSGKLQSKTVLHNIVDTLKEVRITFVLKYLE